MAEPALAFLGKESAEFANFHFTTTGPEVENVFKKACLIEEEKRARQKKSGRANLPEGRFRH